RITGSAPPKYSDPSSAMPSPRSAGADSEAGVTSALAPSEAMVKRPPARSRESSTSIVKVPGTYQGRASRADLMSRMRIQMLSSFATVFTRRESVSSHGSGEYSADSSTVNRQDRSMDVRKDHEEAWAAAVTATKSMTSTVGGVVDEPANL